MTKQPTVREQDSSGSAPRLLVITGVILLAASSWFWWSRVYADPQRAFEGMLGNSLKTSGVNREVTRVAQGNLVNEQIAVSLGGQNRSKTITTVSRGSGQQQAKVVTESIGTLQDDYGRYTNIDTKEAGPSGTPLDFREILNIWGKSDQAASGQKNSASFFNDALIGNIIVPVANLNGKDRQALLQQIAADKVYEVDYSGVRREERNGRRVYVYPVSVHPKPYIVMMQKLTKDIGLGAVEGLDASSYEGASAIKLELTVDVLSRQLVQVTYPSSQNEPGRQEEYTGYGLKMQIDVPKETIPLSELQERLQNLQ